MKLLYGTRKNSKLCFQNRRL